MNSSLAFLVRVVGIAIPIVAVAVVLTQSFPRPQRFIEDEAALAARVIDCEDGFGPPEESVVTAGNVMTVDLATIIARADQVGLGNDQGAQSFDLGNNQTATVKTDIGVCDSPESHYASGHGHFVGRIGLNSGTYQEAGLKDPVTLVWLDRANNQWRFVLIGTSTNPRTALAATYSAGLEAAQFSEAWTRGCAAAKYPACLVPPPSQEPQKPHRLWFAAVKGGSFCQTDACFKP